MALNALSFYCIGILLLPATIFSQNRRGNSEFAHICGKFPNRYFSYEPCPEDERQPSQNQRNRNDQPPRRDQQQQQQVCTRQGWQPIGIKCQNVNDCYQHRENVAMMCEKGQCCSPVVPPTTAGQDQRAGASGRDGPQTRPANADTYVWWQTCENGGYFTGQRCRTTSECRQGYGPGGQRLEQSLAKYEQICLQGECCTTNRELDIENGIANPNANPNQRINTNTNPNSRPGPAVQNPRTNPNVVPANQPNAHGCEKFQGGRLVRNAPPCRRHNDCNRLVGSRSADLVRVGDTQQLACVAQQCCLMNRQLPPGITDWQQICPLRQGSFTGMFCNQNDADCDTSSSSSSSLSRRGSTSSRSMVCELNRYCCTSYIDRNRRQNQGCDDGDMITGSRCDEERDCYRGEYCGDLKLCCLPRRAAQPDEPSQPAIRPQPSPGQRTREPSAAAYCYNGQQSSVKCDFQSDCLETQSCINGLCCVRSGSEWKSACGGAMAVSNCFQDRSCHDSLVCTSSDYCCECPYGQTTGKCTHGCPPNFSCSSNGFCCPRCTTGEQPFGSCFNTRCAPGYTCVAGNICCPNEARSRL
ncbi:hypothetical protein niasHS_017375 [Heterodera schachtii]|uniref:Uncharacterized protein n=1 Tax=Heterodera schachtii TaxID=97005 RepID=A0ABD2HNR0_HETSC